jgi:D-alanyl-D-alanine carboxypeptidase/D-alanyl-D-alanine-endopeptidase (penicillin-binding protein 4)
MKLRSFRKLMILGLGSIVLFAGCAKHPALLTKEDAVSKLRAELDYLFSDPSFANAHWGVAIQSLKNGELLYLHNENKGFMPASNMKLFTTAAALLKLGPNYIFNTRVYYSGTLSSDGVLQGDVIIRGCGDPTICERYAAGNATKVFQGWADSLAARGIRRVTGRIIGDDNYFGDEILGAGWSWDYESDYYAAQISALSFNDNCMDIFFMPGDSLGAPSSFQLRPASKFVSVINKVITADRDKGTTINYNRSRGGNKVFCTGTIFIGEKEKHDWFSVENPTLFAADVFRDILKSEDIEVSGEATDIDDLNSYSYLADSDHELAGYSSPHLSEIVTTVNKVSQNLYAELLLRVVGKEIGGEGRASMGARVAKSDFTAMGIDTAQLEMVDGSGLSRLNLVTPMSVVKLLTYMRRFPGYEAFYNSLPIAGVDGTIRNRMVGTAAQGNVRAKTGYVDKARALSGYATTKDGEELAFSVIVNNYTVATALANQIQDAVCERLANFSR